MNQSMHRRLGRAETVLSEQRTRMRVRVEGVAQRMGAALSASEMDEIADRHLGTPARIRALRREGLADVQILERVMQESTGDAR